MSDISDEAWVACVGEGWRDIVRPLVERCRKEGIQIFQIKEKFGGLRFYTGGSASDEFFRAVGEAEERSYKTCEQCGKPGRARGGGWVKTLCDEHAKGRLELT